MSLSKKVKEDIGKTNIDLVCRSDKSYCPQALLGDWKYNMEVKV